MHWHSGWGQRKQLAALPEALATATPRHTLHDYVHQKLLLMMQQRKDASYPGIELPRRVLDFRCSSWLQPADHAPDLGQVKILQMASDMTHIYFPEEANHPKTSYQYHSPMLEAMSSFFNLPQVRCLSQPSCTP